jgi:NADPH:quinone reductase-like Zn-dependent oxidoreductase
VTALTGAIGCTAVTAWNALTGGKGLTAGDTVLTLGSGAGSLFAIQFAKLCGARVIATTSSAAKATRLAALGADDVIDYRACPEWPDEVRRQTAGRGVDNVVEVGGLGTIERSLRSVAVGGEIAWVGLLADGAPAIDARAIYKAFASHRIIAIGSRAQFLAMNRAIAVNRLRPPVIDRVFAFDEAPAAFTYYAAGHNFGKVVIRVGRQS